MTPSWPVAGGVVKEVTTERNLRDIRKRGGEAERLLLETIKKGLPASGKAGGVLKGEYPNPEFAKEPAYKAELENETTARKEVDKILKEEGEAEKASREAAVKAEKEAREAADSLEKTKREEADNERVKGPASATENDIAIYNGVTGKVIKDSGKTIASVLLEAEETAKALASAAAAGLSIKSPVAYASTANITGFTEVSALVLEKTAPLTIDGASSFAVGTRLLLKNQAVETRNGIWEVTKSETFAGEGKFAGAAKFAEGSKVQLTRTKDADTTEEVKQGMFVLVTKGTTNTATSWLLTTADPIIIGTTAQEYSAFTAAPTGVAGGDLKGTYPNPMLGDKVVVNLDVSDTAGIEYKKLELKEKLKSTDLGAGIRNYGTVTSLPTEPTPAAGDMCVYVADKTNGIYWALVYDGEGTSPWKKIGGPPLSTSSNTARTVNSITYVSLATDPLSIVAPLKGDYDIEIEATLEPAAEGFGILSYAIGATAASDTWCATVGLPAAKAASVGLRTRQTGVAASAKIEEKARTSGVFNCTVTRRRLWVDPTRVG